jgi:hypothetical protein
MSLLINFWSDQVFRSYPTLFNQDMLVTIYYFKSTMGSWVSIFGDYNDNIELAVFIPLLG